MELVARGDGPFRSPPAPNTPTVEVLFGGTPDGPDVGVVRVSVPVGAAMPEHRHGGSDIVLVLLEGSVEVSQGGHPMLVSPHDAVLITKDEAVALRNVGDSPAEFLVAAGPADFVAQVRAWPEPDAD